MDNDRIPSLPNTSSFAMHRWFYRLGKSGLLYHPDDAAADIVDLRSGLPLFEPQECIRLDEGMRALLERHGDKVYETCIKFAQMGARA
jgi:hypothetical protein